MPGLPIDNGLPYDKQIRRMVTTGSTLSNLRRDWAKNVLLGAQEGIGQMDGWMSPRHFSDLLQQIIPKTKNSVKQFALTRVLLYCGFFPGLIAYMCSSSLQEDCHQPWPNAIASQVFMVHTFACSGGMQGEIGPWASFAP